MMSLDKLPGSPRWRCNPGSTPEPHRHRISGDVEEKPFRYHDLGSAAYISRGRAVVSAGPLKVGGFLGWWIWLFIHIAFLTGYRNRVGPCSPGGWPSPVMSVVSDFTTRRSRRCGTCTHFPSARHGRRNAAGLADGPAAPTQRPGSSPAGSPGQPRVSGRRLLYGDLVRRLWPSDNKLVIHLRVVSPPDVTSALVPLLDTEPAVLNLMVLRGGQKS